MPAKITVQGVTLDLPEAPFAEGHVLTADQAGVLNQTWAENLRNNFAPQVRAAKVEVAKANGLITKDGDKDVFQIDAVSADDLDLDALQKTFDVYADAYEFGTRRAGGTRTPTDPVQREAERLAWDKLKEKIQAAGKKVTDIKAEQKAKLVEQVLAKYPEIKAEAARRIKDAAGIDLGALDL